jgi:hypothetical protein
MSRRLRIMKRSSISPMATLLLVSGQWRPERSWVDCAGRLLAGYWIAILPLTSWWDFHTRC